MDSNLSHPKFSHQLIQSIDELCLGEKLLLLNNDFKFEVLDSVNESLDWQLPTIKLTNLNLKDNIFKSFFTLKQNDKNLDKIQQINKNTLFSALVSKQVSDSDGLDLDLDIPDLPDDVSLLKWQIPNTKTFEWVDYTELKEEVKVSNEDEGFYSNKNSPFIKKERQNLPDEIWDEILTLKFSEYLNWDMKKSKERLIIGFNLNKKIDETKLFLIDSSKELFDYFYYHYLNTINIILDRDIAQHKLLIKQSNFIIDCLNCMLSLPSISFVYSRSKSKFVFNTQIQVSGVSSEALASFSEEFTQIGTQHKKILEMLKIPFLNETCGSVVRSFINSIKDYLKFYSEKIIEYFPKVSQMTIIGLYSDIKPLIDQFKCLIKIINLENFDPDEPKSYFKGSDLIFYLFDLTRQSSNNDFSYQISLHLLTGSLEPFFKFIEKWTFEGKFMDKYDQFFIDFNRDFASSRDKNYLNRVYRLKEKFKDVDERDCCFIKNLYEDIFYCGRNLALLRTCDPDNFMCKTKSVYPKLEVNFNETYLSQIEQKCIEYSSLVTFNSKYNLKTRQEYITEQSLIQEDYLERLQNEALERFRQYEREESENRLLEKEAKQKRFNFLKEQMENDLKRRQDEKQLQKQADKEYMDKLVNRNFEFDQEKRKLEEKLKEEIRLEYEAKIKDAEMREKMARQRIQETSKQIEILENSKDLQDSQMDIDMEEEEEIDSNKSLENFIVESAQVDENNQMDVEMAPIQDTPVKNKVNDQTTEKDYKPSIRLQTDVNLLTESPTQVYKPSIRMNEKYHVSKQTDLDDLELKDKNRLEWLKSRNAHVNSSTVQNLIENDEEQLDSLMEQSIMRKKRFEHFTKPEERVVQINFDEIVKPYQKEFPNLDQELNQNITTGMHYVQDNELDFEERKIKLEKKDNQSPYSFNYVNLEEILSRILCKPIELQLSLVNRSIINLFLFDLKLEDHLQALRKYILLENGLFAQKLVDELMVKIEDTHYNGNFLDLEFLLSPIFLKEAFSKTCSLIKNCKFIENISISFSRKDRKNDGFLNYIGMIELLYKVEWPINIIINDTTLIIYNQIFSFLLKIKFVLTALNSIWYTLRRYELIYKSEKSSQLKQLKLYCHEMQHYIGALQSYIYNQVIQVTWSELQKNLNEARNIDDLIQIHENYIKTAHSKCFFKKTPNVVDVILNTFEIIIKFRLLIVNGTLIRNSVTNEYEHEAFGQITENYEYFKNNAVFLHKILQKGISIGYEYHLNNLALTLNYNYYYGNDTPVI